MVVLYWCGEVSVVDGVACNVEVFIHACQFQANVMCHKDIPTNTTHVIFKRESFKVNFNFKRFKVNV